MAHTNTIGAPLAAVAPHAGPGEAARPAAIPGYVPELDALRALAMTMVVAIHCGLLPFGWMGVWLFYVISGFAVTGSMLALAERRPEAGSFIGGFWQRRARRILPVYLMFLALNAVAMLVVGRPEALRELPGLLLFLHNFQMVSWDYAAQPAWPGFGHLWTLSTEQQFYLIFPLLLLLAGRRRGAFSLMLWGLIAVAPLMRWGIGAAAKAAGWDDTATAFTIYALAPGQLDAFAAGALMALHRQRIAAAPRWALYALGAAALVALLHVAVFAAIGAARAGGFSVEAIRNIVSGILYGQGREVSVYWIPVLTGVALVAGMLARRPMWLMLGRIPGAQAVGRISYGGYLFHVPAIMAVVAVAPWTLTSIPGRLVLFVAAMGLTLAMAQASWMLLERRFLAPPARPRQAASAVSVTDGVAQR
ncbi:acyltransferase family protein [Plastoroseomonas arctica]|uniref:Acyltransferase n=1 Tax=Plastoroseomonas arctica TaxID=1509237 RepID=A0AAF1KQB6_9PROT|nr:acyltransferase [Plastoroseomonas arctica]MBR0657403.1 acyltransferase [Plastoroseomonas arctica]